MEVDPRLFAKVQLGHLTDATNAGGARVGGAAAAALAAAAAAVAALVL